MKAFQGLQISFENKLELCFEKKNIYLETSNFKTKTKNVVKRKYFLHILNSFNETDAHLGNIIQNRTNSR